MSKTAGFTLIELLLSVAILTIVAGLSLPFYVSFQNRNELDIATTSIASMLRRAENYSRNGGGDSQWGVAMQSGSATLFKGATYASRDTSYDEIASMSSSIVLSGLSEVAFAKVTALPTTTGSIGLTATTTSDTRTITINAKGMVNY